MRKNLKRFATLAVATALVSTTIVGCGTNDVQESVASKGTESQKVESQTEVKKEEEFSYPLQGEHSITIAAFKNGGFAANEDLDTYADTYWAKTAVEKTGVDVSWIHDTGNSDEWFNFMIADGSYPEIIEWGWNNYPGGAAGAYADGILIELNDVIDEYMPNFKAYLEEHPEIARDIKSDDGKIYYIPQVLEDQSMGGTSGVYFREDILKELGASVPTTLDEWHDLLTQVKEKYNMNFASKSDFLKVGSFAQGYVSAKEYQVNPETGKVEYTYTTDAYRAFLTEMAKWYKEGLIDPDFATLDNSMVKAKILNNETFAAWGWAGSGLQATMISAWETDPDFLLAAAPIVKKDANSEVIYNNAEVMITPLVGITTNCEDIEAAARYLDFWWTEEGINLLNFGEEGVTYTIENGVPTYTDYVLNNEDGLPMTTVMGRYLRAYHSLPTVKSVYYLKGYYQHDNVRNCLEIWGGEGSNRYGLASGTGIAFTEEENTEYAKISTEISTTANEMIVKFVIGEADIDTEWDTYVSNMEKLHVADAVAIYQAAYDRYQSR